MICHFLLWGIFLAQPLNPRLLRLLHCKIFFFYLLSHQRSLKLDRNPKQEEMLLNCYSSITVQSCLTLCDPMDCSTLGLPAAAAAKVLQSCPTLCDSIDGCSLPGSSVHGIFQATVLEWGAIAFSDLGLPVHHQLPVYSNSCPKLLWAFKWNLCLSHLSTRGKHCLSNAPEVSYPENQFHRYSYIPISPVPLLSFP